MPGKPLEPGSYNRLLTIERSAPTATATGGTVPNWTAIATVFGRLKPAGYTEYRLGEKMRERAAVSYAVRKPPTGAYGILVGDRLTDDGQAYVVLAINDVEGARRELLITCQDIAA
jgi:head-tail adaptor